MLLENLKDIFSLFGEIDTAKIKDEEESGAPRIGFVKHQIDLYYKKKKDSFDQRIDIKFRIVPPLQSKK